MFSSAVSAEEDLRFPPQFHPSTRGSLFPVRLLREPHIGLGIGLDYGNIQMVQIGGEFTVVGTPVVYASRMAGAEAGQMYLNEPAYEKIFEQYSAHCDFDECDIEIKHEGNILAYRARLNGKTFEPAVPEWEKPPRDNS